MRNLFHLPVQFVIHPMARACPVRDKILVEKRLKSRQRAGGVCVGKHPPLRAGLLSSNGVAILLFNNLILKNIFKSANVHL